MIILVSIMVMVMLMVVMVIKLMIQVGPGDDYILTVGGFNNTGLSTLGDSMSSNNGMKFTTR